MTENERRILSALSLTAPLSKRDITTRCEIGWATAVKLMSRLEEEGYISASGNERQNQAGKSSALYTLAPTKPVALGIDVEYTRTSLNAENLAQDCLFEIKRNTPAFNSSHDLLVFLDALIQEALCQAKSLDLSIAGIGIGIPSRLFGKQRVSYAEITEELTTRSGYTVVVDNNSRCFAASLASRTPGVSMLVVTIRSGIGVGIVIDGRLYRGENGGAGEMGHFPATANGIDCRCGKTGCLETIVNQAALAADLKAAAEGDRLAQKRVEESAALLGTAIASMMMVLDIRSVSVFADLGGEFISESANASANVSASVFASDKTAGQSLLFYMTQAAEKAVYPGFEFELRFEALDPKAYVAGAVRLVLDQFVCQ